MAGADRVGLRRSSGFNGRAYGWINAGAEDVRAAVRRESINARRLEVNEKFYRTLLQRYTVTIERPEAAKNADAKRLAEAQR